MFLSPKPPILPDHPTDRPIIVGLGATNLLCILAHIWFAPPSAGEATRGYLHGGVAMDFIGQKGPSSKLHLFLLDLLVVILQLVHLAAVSLRKRLRESSVAGVASTNTTQTTAQDLDSEERGVRRSDEQQDIEMQTLNSSGSVVTSSTDTPGPNNPTTATDEAADRESLLASTAPRTDAHVFDAFNSGQIVLADLDLWKTLKDQIQLWKNYEPASASNRTFRQELATRMVRMRYGADTLRQGI